MFPKLTVLRLLVLGVLLIGGAYLHDNLPMPERLLVPFAVLFGGTVLIRLWARQDGPVNTEQAAVDEGDHVWRVRLWVKVAAVGVPLFGLPFVVWPGLINPEWQDGMPPVEFAVVILIYVGLGLVVWAVFRSRLEVRNDLIRVVNPWRVHDVPRSALVAVRPGTRGLKLVLEGGNTVVVFAVQCVAGFGGHEPRWVSIARAITGDPTITDSTWKA
ncbi:hypothetical protein [Lentzea terrae]|uniref:hypothetical protein n=1 Tax=Lentzea terrae TaxID=2200761 RepID=UPI000DD488B7|nr:hypothetical protein [Lentzea terrae]